MKTGADVLVEALVGWGVRHLFGMPGSHSTAIYDAIGRDGTIGTTLIRNEQAGAFAADGYARVAGKPGVVCTTAGPGATNALTGVAECWADSMPILLLAGQVNSDALDRECGNYHVIRSHAGRRGTYRKRGRRYLEGPGTIAVSAGLSKMFPVRERLRFRFEATFTNALNHTNFAPPATDISSASTFGVLQSAQTAGQGGNRTGQLALRMDF